MAPGASVLVVCLAANAAMRADEGPAAVLTSLLTAELDKRTHLSVLSSADLRQALALEAQKQALGCDSDSCLAEVAGAMGVDYIVHGQLGRLERSQVLSLTLFDARLASSAGRTLVRGDTVDAIAAQLPVAVDSLLTKLKGAQPVRASAHKVLVMDLRQAGVVDAPAGPVGAVPDSKSMPFPWLAVAGGGTLALGATALAAGAIAGLLSAQSNGQAEDSATTQRRAADLYDQRDLQALVANVLFGVAGAGALVGGAALGLSLLGGE